ncbi:hypothetical protein BDA99DRAFT_542557 [Phascolomyces articulosus]|uniref:Uncharacterized protein n=1 Tax=Phascolomyces articulosus TaxID=60185 RepID=A0AAD5JZ42_9FUNG|nr:hypothetical protein BDA99DRAFT_542557 [Phascolomyces articulosus]
MKLPITIKLACHFMPLKEILHKALRKNLRAANKTAFFITRPFTLGDWLDKQIIINYLSFEVSDLCFFFVGIFVLRYTLSAHFVTTFRSHSIFGRGPDILFGICKCIFAHYSEQSA